MTEPNVTPAVRKVAAAHDVNLSAVAPTGAGGRVTVGDVRAAAGLPRAPEPPRYVAPASGSHGSDVRRNPLLAAAASTEPGRVRAATAKAPAPTLFTGGDLPPFTASGIDPTALLKVPWQARHPMAQAPTPAGAYAILASFEGITPEEAQDLATLEYNEHPSNREYRRRMDDWLLDGMTGDQLFAASGFTDKPAPPPGSGVR